MNAAFIGLGSNLGERKANLSEACRKLSLHPDVEIIRKSSIKKTNPVDYLDQPLFLNQIVLIDTALSPYELLKVLQKIESEMGRIRSVSKGPRIIDLDILLYNNIIIDTPDLAVPHREITNRKFILEHLVELNPDITDPVSGEFYRDIMLLQ